MTTVFFDTVGFLALWNARDPWHAEASAAFAKLTASGAGFITTTLVMLECGNSAARTRFRSDVVELRRQLHLDGRLIDPTQDDLEFAWTAYARGEAASAGIVDHISFMVMRRLGITEAFTNDRHFKAAGFQTLF